MSIASTLKGSINATGLISAGITSNGTFSANVSILKQTDPAQNKEQSDLNTDSEKGN